MEARQSVEEIARSLGTVNALSDGSWMAICPAHDDKNPSLHLTPKPDGGLLWQCFAGCSQGAVEEALKLRQLLPRTDTGARAPAPACVRRWTYTDVNGKPAFRVLRDDCPGPCTRRECQEQGPHKHIWQAKIGATFPKPRPLYRLPDLLADPAQPVLVVEGEKAADAAAGLYPGAAVTTSSQGAGNAKHSDWHPVEGRTVIIWPDHDEPGTAYAEEVSQLCETAGAARVHVYEYPEGVPFLKGWDLADPLPDGYTLPDFDALQAPARRWTRTLGELMAAPKEPKPWTVAGLLTAGRLSMLHAQPGDGKSVCGRTLGYAVATGRPWLGRAVEQGPVLLMALEDDTDQIEFHLARLGATGVEPIHIWDMDCPPPDDIIDALAEAVEEIKPALIVVDPMLDFLGQVKDFNQAGEVNAPLVRLKAIARSSGAHMMLIHHAGKNGDYLGSTAFKAAVDVDLALEKRAGQHVLTVKKQRRMDADAFPPTVLRLNPDTLELEAEDGGSLVDVAEQRTVEKDAKLRRVEDYLRAADVPRTIADMAKALDIPEGTLSKMVLELVNAGRVERKRQGKGYVYRPTPPTPPTPPEEQEEQRSKPIFAPPPPPDPREGEEEEEKGPNWVENGAGQYQPVGNGSARSTGAPQQEQREKPMSADRQVERERQYADFYSLFDQLRELEEAGDMLTVNSMLEELRELGRSGNATAQDAVNGYMFDHAKRHGYVEELLTETLGSAERMQG